jgi:hypothetical protein
LNRLAWSLRHLVDTVTGRANREVRQLEVGVVGFGPTTSAV